VTVCAHAFSKSAAAKIQKAGGKVILLASGAPEQNAST
jgi:ribosomal protein L18E